MKKVVITACAFALATCGFAQKKNVSGAEGKLYDPVDLDGAKSLIETAMKDATTTNDPKTYWVAAEVYEKTYEHNDTQRQLNKPFDQKVIDEVLVKAVDAYKKTYELELIPDAKGKVKQKYSKLIPDKLEKYANYLVNAGLAEYNNKDFKTAVELWGKYLEMADYTFMGQKKMKADSLYNEIKYYSINAASQATGLEELSIKYMEDLKGEPKYSQTMYEWLYNSYQKKGNNDKMVSTLKEAVDKFPNNTYFIGSLINYYITNKKEAEAISYVDEAIAKDPKNPQYYIIKSQMNLQKANYIEAIKAAEQAIAVDANNFDANYYAGLAYIKKGEDALNKASNIKNNAQYQKAKELANEEFKKAIPYLEKARVSNPKDSQNLNFLKTAYYRIGNGAKYTEIDNEMKKLQ